MIRYQTEVVVAPDRYLCIQLPPTILEGRAIVTVLVEEPQPVEVAAGIESEFDDEDIEWWEEFEDRFDGR